MFFKAACHANPRAERNFAKSSSYILKHIFLKFSNSSANSNVLSWTWKSWFSPKFFISESLKLYESRGDKNGKLSLYEYFDNIKPHLKDMIGYYKSKGE